MDGVEMTIDPDGALIKTRMIDSPILLEMRRGEIQPSLF